VGSIVGAYVVRLKEVEFAWMDANTKVGASVGSNVGASVGSIVGANVVRL